MIALGGEDGAVRFYDNQFRSHKPNDSHALWSHALIRLEAWFEDMEAGPISSLSFAAEEIREVSGAVLWCPRWLAHCSMKQTEQKDPSRLDFNVPDFMVTTSQGYIVGMESRMFEEVSVLESMC